jgi:hypothetical protein
MPELTLPQHYGEPLTSLVVLDEAGTLDAGIPQEMVRARLEELTPEALCSGQELVDEDSAQCCISAIWLLHHFLDESHVISQEITTSSGSFWHGILHRREGDYSNAKYWFRRVVDHPVYELLATTSQQLQDQHQWPGSLPLGGTQWDPYKFVEMCEDVVVNGGGNRVLCEALARLEWQLLFDNCYRRAIGSG